MYEAKQASLQEPFVHTCRRTLKRELAGDSLYKCVSFAVLRLATSWIHKECIFIASFTLDYILYGLFKSLRAELLPVGESLRLTENRFAHLEISIDTLVSGHTKPSEHKRNDSNRKHNNVILRQDSVYPPVLVPHTMSK